MVSCCSGFGMIAVAMGGCGCAADAVRVMAMRDGSGRLGKCCVGRLVLRGVSMGN